MPLRLGGLGVGVQLERRTEGHAAVGEERVERGRRGRRLFGDAGGIDEGKRHG